jgi:hypothetical protein
MMSGRGASILLILFFLFLLLIYGVMVVMTTTTTSGSTSVCGEKRSKIEIKKRILEKGKISTRQDGQKVVNVIVVGHDWMLHPHYQ